MPSLQFFVVFGAVAWAVIYLVRHWQRTSPWETPVAELSPDDFLLLKEILSESELQYVVFRRKLLELDTLGHEKSLADVVREFHNH